MRDIITTLLLVLLGGFSLLVAMGCEPCDPNNEQHQCQVAPTPDPDPNPTPNPTPDPDPVEEVHVNPFNLDRAYPWLEGDDTMRDQAGNAYEICAEIDSYVRNEVKSDEWLEIQCTTQGLVFGDSEDSCEERRTACIMDGQDSELSQRGSSCDNLQPEQCDATMDEIEVCYFEIATALSKLARDLTCSDSLADVNTGYGTSSCDVVKQKCPSLLATE